MSLDFVQNGQVKPLEHLKVAHFALIYITLVMLFGE